MRHTSVSLWVASGASAMEIATYAGHRSAFFTKDRYAHLFKERAPSWPTGSTPSSTRPGG